jgi:hypothetical protein
MALHSKRSPKLLSWTLLIALLSVIIPEKSGGEFVTKFQQVQIHYDKPACLLSVIKTKPSVPIKECPAGIIASATEVFTSIWKLLPKFLLVSLSERNSFYTRVTINAP